MDRYHHTQIRIIRHKYLPFCNHNGLRLYYTIGSFLNYFNRLMNKQKINAIFTRFQQANPLPTTELVYHSPFELLVAVILSAQATDISVNKATAKLFPVAD